MSTQRHYPTGSTDQQAAPAARAAHTAEHLAFAGVNDIESCVYYIAPSASRPGHINEVALCALTGATICDCRGAEFGQVCWHQREVRAAFAAHPAVRDAACLSDERLLAYGAKLASYTRQYRERCGRALPLDSINLVAARFVWAERHPLGEVTA